MCVCACLQRFSIELFAPTGGARLGSQSMIVVAIDQNDFANGLIGFAGQSLTVSNCNVFSGAIFAW